MPKTETPREVPAAVAADEPTEAEPVHGEEVGLSASRVGEAAAGSHQAEWRIVRDGRLPRDGPRDSSPGVRPERDVAQADRARPQADPFVRCPSPGRASPEAALSPTERNTIVAAIADGFVPSLRRDPLWRVRHLWRHYNRPGSDVLGRVDIGMGRVSARSTGKGGLIGSVLSVAVAAGMARLRRVRCIDHHERNPGPLRLVGEMALQLAEGPAAHPGALSFGKPYPRSDVRQILDGNTALRVLGKANNLLADAVIFMGAKPRLFPAESLLRSAYSTRALAALLLARCFTVQPLPAQMTMSANNIHPIANERLAVAGGGEIHDAHIDTNEARDGNGRGFWHFDAGVEVERAFSVDQINAVAYQVPSLALIIPDVEWHQGSAGARQDAGECVAFERERTLVVAGRACRPEHWSNTSISGKDSSGLTNGPYRELSGKTVLRSESCVAKSMDSKGTRHAEGCPNGGRIGRGSIERSHHVEQQQTLFGAGVQRDLQGQFHAGNIVQGRAMNQSPPPSPIG